MGANTLVAYGALSLALKYVEANKISLIITMNPILTLALLEVLLWLDVGWFEIRPVGGLAYLGAALVMIGAVLAISRGIRLTSKRS